MLSEPLLPPRWPLRGRGAQDDPPGRQRRDFGRADAALQGDVVPGPGRVQRTKDGENDGNILEKWKIWRRRWKSEARESRS